MVLPARASGPESARRGSAPFCALRRDAPISSRARQSGLSKQHMRWTGRTDGHLRSRLVPSKSSACGLGRSWSSMCLFVSMALLLAPRRRIPRPKGCLGWAGRSTPPVPGATITRVAATSPLPSLSAAVPVTRRSPTRDDERVGCEICELMDPRLHCSRLATLPVIMGRLLRQGGGDKLLFGWEMESPSFRKCAPRALHCKTYLVGALL